MAYNIFVQYYDLLKQIFKMFQHQNTLTIQNKMKIKCHKTYKTINIEIIVFSFSQEFSHRPF